MESIGQMDYVHCTKCKHFSIGDNKTPQCPLENKCHLWDCEDGRRFFMRPYYEEMVVNNLDRETRLKTEIYDVLIDAVDNGIDDAGEFDEAVRVSAEIIKLVNEYVKSHGDIALSCGAEWMYQSDSGQTDALELVGDILKRLSDYAYDEED